MKVYEKRNDGLTYVGYWTISVKRDIYVALFVDTEKINTFVIMPMNGIGDLQEKQALKAEAKDVGKDLRICYYYQLHAYKDVYVTDMYSLGGKEAVFNNFTLVNPFSFRWNKSDIIHFGTREEVNVYTSK